jgi:toxin ParE1/3/4
LEIKLTPEAFDDLRSAWHWYEQQRSGLGSAFERSIDATLSRIQRLPLSCPVVLEPFRRAAVRRFPYDVYYEVAAGSVLVVLVFHTARDPASALARLRQH